jgi:hypothetical protein
VQKAFGNAMTGPLQLIMPSRLKTVQSCIGFVQPMQASTTTSSGSEKKCFISRHLRRAKIWHAA